MLKEERKMGGPRGGVLIVVVDVPTGRRGTIRRDGEPLDVGDYHDAEILARRFDGGRGGESFNMIRAPVKDIKFRATLKVHLWIWKKY